MSRVVTPRQVVGSAIACLVLAACGSGETGGTGTGGAGGSGATGGTAGSGGTGGGGEGGGEGGGSGGSGGTVVPCGNGRLDDGEACDDGNATSGDGCSVDCTVEGDCQAPLDYHLLAEPNGDQLEVRGFLPDEGELSGSCGGDGPERVFRYHSSQAGSLRFAVASTDETVVTYSRSSCSDAGSELSCAIPQSIREVAVGAGEDLFLVVDGGPQSAGKPYLIATFFSRFRNEGESCNTADRCMAGLICSASTSKCIQDTAPTLGSASALKGGESSSDLVIFATGQDSTANTGGFLLQFLDASGEPVDTGTLAFGVWDPTTLQLIISFEGSDPLPAGTNFQAWSILEGFFASYPAVTQVSVRLRDQNNLSNERTVAVTDQVVAGRGETCDLIAPTSRCDTGLICLPGPSSATCESLDELRAEACAQAPALVLGELYSGSSQDGPSLWTPPAGCVPEWEASEEELSRKPEAVLRLSLAEDVTNLRVTTSLGGTGIQSVLYMLPGCGLTADEPLACNFKDTTWRERSTIELPAVPAGDYLVVVDTTRRAGAFEIQATAD